MSILNLKRKETLANLIIDGSFDFFFVCDRDISERARERLDHVGQISLQGADVVRNFWALDDKLLHFLPIQVRIGTFLYYTFVKVVSRSPRVEDSSEIAEQTCATAGT